MRFLVPLMTLALACAPALRPPSNATPAPAIRYASFERAVDVAIVIERRPTLTDPLGVAVLSIDGHTVGGIWSDDPPIAFALGNDLFLLAASRTYLWDRSVHALLPLPNHHRVRVPGTGYLLGQAGRDGAFELSHVDARGPWLERLYAAAPSPGETLECSVSGAREGAPVIICREYLEGRPRPELRIATVRGPGHVEEQRLPVDAKLNLLREDSVRGDALIAIGPPQEAGSGDDASGPHSRVYLIELRSGRSRVLGLVRHGTTRFTGAPMPCVHVRWSDVRPAPVNCTEAYVVDPHTTELSHAPPGLLD